MSNKIKFIFFFASILIMTVSIHAKEIEMKFINGGIFWMGSNDIINDLGSQPVHHVTLSSFYMDSTEVTQNDYLSLMGVNPSFFQGDLSRPVENVTWFDAVLYCNARSKAQGLDTVYTYSSVSGTPGNICTISDIDYDFLKKGYRLPTEAEWEYACRAGTTTEYYWGDAIDGNYCWYSGNSGNTTHTVATTLPNAWGLYDMSGNVFNWCNDWYGNYCDTNQINPVGPATGTARASRGGSWCNFTWYLGSANRGGAAPPDGHSGATGFRCVLPGNSSIDTTIKTITVYSTNDGGIQNVGESNLYTFDQILNGTGGSIEQISIIATIYASKVNDAVLNPYTCARSFLTFKVQLPVGSIITGATLSIYGDHKNGGCTPKAYQLYNCGDYGTFTADVVHYVHYVGNTLMSDASYSYESFAAPGWNNYPLNTAAVSSLNKNGNNFFSLRETNGDVKGIVPNFCGNYEYVELQFSADANSPKLVINYVVNSLDTDGDGMPDAWENQYPGLNPLVNDANEDLDGDGFTNLQEYLNGTDPTKADIPINSPPSKVSLISPLNDVTIYPAKDELRWNQAIDIDGDKVQYCVVIKKDSEPEDIPIYKGCDQNIFQTQNSLSLSAISELVDGQRYWWAVWAKDEKGAWSEASDWGSFITEKRNNGYPVIIIPGIMGSSIVNSITSDTLWQGNTNINFDNIIKLNALKMNDSGMPIEQSTLPSDIITNLNLHVDIGNFKKNVLNKDIFQGLINSLKTNGYKEDGIDQNLFTFAYDWRRDLNKVAGFGNQISSANTLKGMIDSVKMKTGSNKVDLICHCMGSLLAKTYIWHFGESSINKLIMIGTPHFGAPLAFNALAFGEFYGFQIKAIKDIDANMPSLYQLLPSFQYFNYNQLNPCNGDDYYCNVMYIFKNTTDQNGNSCFKALDYNQSISYLKDTIKLNPINISNAVQLHDAIDGISFTNSYNIIGSGVGTLSKNLVVNSPSNNSTSSICTKKIYYRNGDGTVPIESSEGLFGSNNYYVDINDKYLHMKLPSITGVPQLVLAILNGEDAFFDYSKYSISKQPKMLSGKSIDLGCPVDLHIYDYDNRHTGPINDGTIEEYASGVSYNIIDNHKFAFLPSGNIYMVVGKATNLGTADLKIETISNNTYSDAEYYDEIPLNSDATSFRIDISAATTPDVIKIDSDGDGIFERNISPDAILQPYERSDLISPSTSAEISGLEGTNGYFKSVVTISLIGTDNTGGSSILNTRYSLDNGSIWQVYAIPITINQNGNIKILYYSTDRNGNKETVNEKIIKIDQSFPTISLSASPTILWPPNKAMINVAFSGNANDDISGINAVVLEIIDEYGILNKTLSALNCTVPLEAWRQGNDKDGRKYTIRVTAIDNAGNSSIVTTNVICPHDQGK